MSFIKNNIKDIGNVKDIFTFMKMFLKVSFIYLLIFIFFWFGSFLAAKQNNLLNEYETKQFDLKVTGIVVSSETTQTGNNLVLRLESLEKNNVLVTDLKDIKYAQVFVSSLQEFDLYARVVASGKNMVLDKVLVSEKQNLLEKYETKKLLFNPEVRVFVQTIYESKEGYTKSFLENLIYHLDKVKKSAIKNIQKSIHEPYASVANGILLGEASFISKSLKDIFVQSGLVHILVLSGTNITLVIVFIWWIFSFLDTKKRLFVSLLFAWIFIFLTGITSPALRAGAMTSLILIAKVFGKKSDPLNILILAIFIQTIINPLAIIYSPSLHLSFLATFALFITLSAAEKTLQKIKKVSQINFLEKVLLLAFCMTLATTPYLLSLTGKSSLVGSFLTILVEPFIFGSMFFSSLTIFFGYFFESLSNIFGVINYFLIWCIIWIASISLQFVDVVSFSISAKVVVLYYIIFLSLSIFLNKEN